MHSKFIVYIISIIVLILISGGSNAVTYEFDFNGEPAGDVSRFDQYGNVTIVDTFPELDIKKFETKNGTGDNLTFILGTKAKQITTSEDVKYVFRIFTEPDNRTGYNITYRNGTFELVTISNGAEVSTEDLTALGGIVKVKNEDLLEFNLPKNKYIPNSTLDYLAVDGFSWMEAGNYTYVDYIHNVPGNPGTIAPDITEDPNLSGGSDDDKESDSKSSYLIFIIPVIIIVVILLLVLMRKRK